MEKEHFQYFTFLIEIKDIDQRNKLIRDLNVRQGLLGEEFRDITYTNEHSFFIKFRLSMNTSDERANYNIVEKIYGLSHNDMMKLTNHDV